MDIVAVGTAAVRVDLAMMSSVGAAAVRVDNYGAGKTFST